MDAPPAIIRGFTARLYPTAEQARRLCAWSGSVRFVWNRLLDAVKTQHATDGTFLWRKQLQARAVALKAEHEWLRDVPAHAILKVAADLDAALRKMVRERKAGRHCGFPRPKKKFVREAGIYCVNQQTVAPDGNRKVRLPKLGAIRIRGWRGLPGRLLSARVMRDAGDRWMLSVQVETEPPAYMPPVVERVGVDLGIKHLATIYDGQTVAEIENRRPLRNKLKRLRRLERAKSRRRKGSARRRTMAHRIGVLHRKIRLQRADALHQLSHLLTAKAGVIVVEDLNVKAMQRGRYARQIADVGLGMFLRLVAYKAKWRGRELIKADRFFPSSQISSCCGTLHPEMRNGLPTLRCVCGSVLDRDHNAAINLYWYPEERGNRRPGPATRGDSGDQAHGPAPLDEPRTFTDVGSR